MLSGILPNASQRSTDSDVKLPAIISASSRSQRFSTRSWLAFSQLHIALLATVLMSCSGILTGSKIPSEILAAGSLGALSIYLVDRLLPSNADLINNPQRTQWFTENRWVVGIAITTAGLVGLAIFSQLDLATKIVALVLLTIAAAYVIPPRPLKNLPLLKPFMIALAWSAGVALLPLAFSSVGWGTIVVLMVYRFFYLLPNCLLADLNDSTGDVMCGSITPATRLGQQRIKTAIHVSVMFGLIGAGLLYMMGVDGVLLLVDMAGMSFFMVVATNYSRGNRVGTLILDLALLWPASLFVVRVIQNLA